MSNLEMPPLGIEHGCATISVNRVEEEAKSVSFSDIDEGGGSECEMVEERVVARRLSSVAQAEVKVILEEVGRDCRICHMGLDNSGGDENGGAIELGCSCKDGLAAAHKKCAETWFKIKGNKTCEICNSIARNIVVPSEANSSNSLSEPVSSASDTQSCFNGHRFMNFLLASCILFIFLISWLFHYIPIFHLQ